MIAIGAQANFDYAEPVTTKNVNPHSQVDDKAREIENEETENKQGSFAEILAGLLNGSVQSAEVSDIEADGSFVKLEGLDSDIPLNEFDFSDIAQVKRALSEENENILSGTENRFDDNLLAGFFDNLQAGLAEEEAQRTLSEISVDDEASLKKAALLSKNEKSEADLSARLAQNAEVSAMHSDEALAAENAAKKNRAALEDNANAAIAAKTLSKSDKNAAENADAAIAAKALAAAKKSGEENAVARNAKDEPSQREGRLDELRGRSRKDKISFDIRDQRTMIETASRSFTSAEAAAGRMTDTPSSKDITLELRLPDYNNSGQNSQTTWETKAASAMENMLARELHNNFNGDIVRHASMALRDGGESVIRLALRPDSLGNVKIRLEMTDNKITGFIVVESEEALNAFRKEIAALEEAFKDAGFADADLDLSLSYNGEENASLDAQARQERDENVFASQLAALSYEDALRENGLETQAMIDVFGHGERSGLINVLA